MTADPDATDEPPDTPLPHPCADGRSPTPGARAHSPNSPPRTTLDPSFASPYDDWSSTRLHAMTRRPETHNAARQSITTSHLLKGSKATRQKSRGGWRPSAAAAARGGRKSRGGPPAIAVHDIPIHAAAGGSATVGFAAAAPGASPAPPRAARAAGRQIGRAGRPTRRRGALRRRGLVLLTRRPGRKAEPGRVDKEKGPYARDVPAGLGRRDGGKPNGQVDQSHGGVGLGAGEDGGDDLGGSVSPAASGMRGGGPGARRVDRAMINGLLSGLRGEHSWRADRPGRSQGPFRG